MIERALVGLVVSIAVSAAGWRARVLAGSGALVAVGVGTAVVAGLGWSGAVLLGTFFGSSSLLTRWTREHGVAAKGHRRDAAQVLANGGIAAVMAVLALAIGEATAFACAAGSLAAATADTWATEIGSGSRRPPRLIISRRVVPPGTSGGVTRRGSAGAVAGALAIAMVAGLLVTVAGREANAVKVGAVVFLAGLGGSLVDSVLGETVQERRRCPACDAPTDARVHRCGRRTLRVGGVPGVDNDVVNAGCTLAGAALGILVLA